jgi:hypothetical protein
LSIGGERREERGEVKGTTRRKERKKNSILGGGVEMRGPPELN